MREKSNRSERLFVIPVPPFGSPVPEQRKRRESGDIRIDPCITNDASSWINSLRSGLCSLLERMSHLVLKLPQHQAKEALKL